MADKIDTAIPQLTGFVSGAPRALLRIEAFALAIAAIIAFSRTGESWWIFAALILAPDLSMLGYLTGARRGAIAYNAVHVYVGPLLLAGAGMLAASSLVEAAAFIWAAHIAIDRTLGYGLKYPDGFAFTHLGRIGRAGAA
jgi:hypothetical protein